MMTAEGARSSECVSSLKNVVKAKWGRETAQRRRKHRRRRREKSKVSVALELEINKAVHCKLTCPWN
jgi:hypothetical protein